MEVTVLNKQSLLDVALQHTGTVANAFDIAVANQISVSDFVEPGSVLIIPEVILNVEILNYFKVKKLKPATAFIDGENITVKKGIGWMKVASTFKVD